VRGRDGPGLANFGELVFGFLARQAAGSIATRRVCLESNVANPFITIGVTYVTNLL
jgi:hypothetical protein